MLHTARWLLAVAFLVLCGSAEAKPRIYVLYGQGGAATSLGMVALADRLKAHGTVIKHGWDWGHGPATIAADIRRQPATTKIVLVTFSVWAGGSMIMAAGIPNRKIDLVVAYDPTRLQSFPAAPSNIKRVLLYHNRCAAIWGGGVIRGPQVETTTVCSLHLAVDFNESLHAKTIAAVRRI